MKKKTKVEETPKPLEEQEPTVDYQEVLRQNSLLREMKNLEDKGYYRLQMTTLLGNINQNLTELNTSLKEVLENLDLEEEEDEPAEEKD